LFAVLAALTMLATGAASQAKAQPIPLGKPCSIVSQGSGMVLDVPGGSPLAKPIQQYVPNGGLNQKWLFVPVKPGSKYFYIRNCGNGHVLDVPGGNPNSGVLIQTFPFNGGFNQMWVVRHSAGNYVNICNVATGKALDVPGLSLLSGTPIQQYPLNDGPNQRWSLVP
jgi:hypothetical protein